MSNLLATLKQALDEHNAQVDATYGTLSADQLNWKFQPNQWSIGQCIDHLITTNEAYFPALKEVIAGTNRSNLWKKIPGVPQFFGRWLINNTGPEIKSSKMQAPGIFRPAESNLPADMVSQFIDNNEQLKKMMDQLEEESLVTTIISSPATGLIVLSVADALKVMVQHEERHINQMGRVFASPGFPSTE